MIAAHVAVCVPSRDMVHSGFAFDLCRAVAKTECDISLLNVQGTLIVNQRTGLAQNAIEMGASHVLFLDDDMRFPSDAIERLLAHDKDVVAVNYPTRKFPIQPVAFADDKSHERVFTNPDSTGLEAVAAVGMGIMLVKAEVFVKIGMPYFMIGYSPATAQYTGEDVYFCRKVRAAGYEVFIDHDLSKEVKHTGAIEFQHEHIWAANGDQQL